MKDLVQKLGQRKQNASKRAQGDDMIILNDSLQSNLGVGGVLHAPWNRDACGATFGTVIWI